MPLFLLLSAVGCVNNEIDNIISAYDPDAENIITATIESSKTRTSLGQISQNTYKPMWEEGDQLAVFIGQSKTPSLYNIVKGAGTSEAVFAGTGKSGSYAAYYPYDGVTSRNGNILEVNLPAEQIYMPSSFAGGAYPMVAVSDSESFRFKNLCSILKVSLKGNLPVTSVVLKANSDAVKVSGKASIDLNYDGVPSIEMSSDAYDQVTLVCDGVTLDTDAATDFYFVIPAQTYTDGLTLIINGPDGVMIKTTDEDVVMQRSQLRAIPEFVYEPAEPVVPSASLEGEGTEASPFLIQNLSDLLLLQQQCNVRGGMIAGVNASEAYYRQTADISLAQVCGNGFGNWTPIADYASDEELGFEGSYDGGGYSITDLYINAPDKDYQGLFGHHVGRLLNLTISGKVIGKNYVGIAVGTYFNCHHVGYTCIDNVIVNGQVTGNDYVGGISGEYSHVSNSINKAVVKGHIHVGGIVGVTSTEIISCKNESEVKGYGKVGGVVGNHNAGLVLNCVNKADVEGYSQIGGITGFSRQHGKVLNNMNAGCVSGSKIVGGITGLCSDDSTSNGPTAVKNNINVGEVSGLNSATYIGAICGYNKNEVTNNYWLYDPALSKGMETGVNNDGGQVADNMALTEAQLKGETSEVPYYVSGWDSYYDIVDALTAWAADNSDTSQLDHPVILNGWRYSAVTGYPETTGQPAEKPEGGVGKNPIFEISTDRFEVSCYESEIEVYVRTNMSYSISSMPEWIEEVEVTRMNSGCVHLFSIARNYGLEPREGVIVFCNEEQTCVPVIVVQEKADPVGDEWKSRDFYHRSLAMRFTADWCGYCPMMASAIDGVKEAMPEKIEAVSMHVSGGLNFSQASVLANRFQVGSYPTLIMDSRADVPNYSPISYTSGLIKSVLEETEAAYPPMTGISFNSYLNGQKITVNLKLYVKEADEYKVTVLVLEDEIVAYQNGAGDNYEHNDVVRLALTDIAGDAVSVKEDNTVWIANYVGNVPSHCDTDNLRVLVYVEKPYGSRGLVTTVQNVDYLSWYDMYVDNCRSGNVGKSVVLQYADDVISEMYQSTDYSADGRVKVLQEASVGNGIDIVLMGDAFSDRLIADGTYDDVMMTAYQKFFEVEPYKSFRDMFNVYSVDVVSPNETFYGETAFSCWFGDGTHVGGNDNKVFRYAQNAISAQRMDEALIIVMMNSPSYAGTCYMYYGNATDCGSGVSVSYFPIGTDDEQLAQVLHHEAAGHGFAKLADEYAYESYGRITPDEQASYEGMRPYGWWKNVDFTNDPSKVKWAGFLSDSRYAYDGLGVFEGGCTYWSGVWRPTEYSIMRHNTGGFNAPSREAIYYRIHKLAYGSAWEYDYEEFVRYDERNRGYSAGTKTRSVSAEADVRHIPTAPPVVVGKSWRDAR